MRQHFLGDHRTSVTDFASYSLLRLIIVGRYFDSLFLVVDGPAGVAYEVEKDLFDAPAAAVDLG